MRSGTVSSASAYAALAEAITDKFALSASKDGEAPLKEPLPPSGAGQGINPHPDPRLATHGEEPQMAFEQEQEQGHRRHNGPDKHFIRQLQTLIGRVRFGWSIVITSLSPIFLLAALLVHNGWITTPAKDSDVKSMQVKLTAMDAVLGSHIEAMKDLGLMSARLEEGQKAMLRVLDKVDGKLDRIEEQHLAIMRAFFASTQGDAQPQPQNAAPQTQDSPAPAVRPHRRAKSTKKQESGGLLLFH